VLDAAVGPEVKFFHEGTLAKVEEALGESAFQSAFDERSKRAVEEMVYKVLSDWKTGPAIP